jgi:two-component system, chemotaxis family, CheB/CheR fusion protein
MSVLSSRSEPREQRLDICPVVGVACSKGDLEAVCELLSALPASCGAALIVVQHLEPRHDKSLICALAERTVLPVAQAHGGVTPKKDHVYVISAGTTLKMVDGRIFIAATSGDIPRPADVLLASLAEELGARAMGVVLSGGGNDGAAGIQAIYRRGGATFAQYPGSARFPSMPISAIETGCVGYVMRPNEIALEVIRQSRKLSLADAAPRHLSVLSATATAEAAA